MNELFDNHAASKTTWDLVPRKVHFEWNNVPFAWIPSDRLASHAINHFSFSLVRGEYFFCRIFNKALPYIEDEKLKEDVKIFIRQEAIHAQAHKESIELYLKQYGVDIEANYDRAMQLFDRVLADDPVGIKLPKSLKKQWLVFRVALVAAAEHFTCALGQFALTRAEWGKRGGDPMVTDLFTWHGAEEVEHRAVAYDLFQYLSGNYGVRAMSMLLTLPAFSTLMILGTVKLMEADHDMPKSKKSLFSLGLWKGWNKSARHNLVPTLGWFIKESISFFNPKYHPNFHGDTELAVAYMNQSPAVLAFEQHVSRAP
ncbi:metal-dependent hydrolase [Acinetobacter sp. WU_MDCI_Axc73]|nr:metal-dependent hydrolase [Acinetobacter sp. WU_MDCI_Axc73]